MEEKEGSVTSIGLGKDDAIKETLESLKSEDFIKLVKESDSYLFLFTSLKGRRIRGFVSRGGAPDDQDILTINGIKKLIESLESLKKVVFDMDADSK